MTKLLEVSKAARMAGVPREEIQRHIAEGTLSAFEGKVEFVQLSAIYPKIEGDRESVLDALSQIKEDALEKSIRQQSGVPDTASLLDEVEQLRTEVAHYRYQVSQYRQLTLDLKHMLMDLRVKVSEKQRIVAVIRWLEQKTKKLS